VNVPTGQDKVKPNLFGQPKRRRLFAFTILGMVVLLSTLRVYAAKNYPDEDYPYYSGTYATESPKPVEALTVVSYNIWFAEDIDQALLEIKEIKSQKGLDILLLQEMDEAGTEKIARELRLDYVYFPAAVEPTYGKNFGNAILSRWSIVDSQKLILPHKSLSNRMNRIATRATIRVHDDEILVYSIHTESIFSLPQFRQDQYTAVINDTDPQTKHVIVGGDFNSFIESDVEEVEEVYRQAGFMRASEDSGYTIVKYGIGVASDHIFTKGFVLEETGKLAQATASDHLPIWVRLMLK
jgi:endonuclease/exonuclease/phosphatase family metal-dependent hydrolase